MMIDLIKLDTEKNNHRTIDIDAVSTEEILRKINNEDKTVASIVEESIGDISILVDRIVNRMKVGGRLFYMVEITLCLQHRKVQKTHLNLLQKT